MEKTDKQRLMKAFSGIVSLSQSDIEIALPNFSFQSYQPEEYIFKTGQQITDVYFVLKGIGRYFYCDDKGKEMNKSLVRAGGAFTSISSVVEGAPSPFYAQALIQCEIAKVNYEALVEIARKNSRWGDFVRHAFERLVIKKEKREAGLLMLTAKERYLEFLEEFGDDSHKIALRHVAMYLGITDVSLSRIRRELGLT